MTEAGAEPGPGGPFVEGERVLLVDHKNRTYLLRLRGGRSFQSHAGVVDHDAVIGAVEGSEIGARRTEGDTRTPAKYLAIRPRLADLVINMPRGAQVIYPKDLGAILMAADIFPGARVLEAGVGSGALSMTLLRAGASVTGYEIRNDFAEHARRSVEEALGSLAGYEVLERDIYDGVAETGLDRVVLDLPEPWRVVPHAAACLVPGGILCSYVPSINQTASLRAALANSPFGLAETFEVLHRTWHIEGRSVRPDQRMVGHTGFITTARLLRRGGGGTGDSRSEPQVEESCYR
ncbi:MAG: tRNA (adenine-N1)-methyltransferase [Acidimicrobiales bacterium]